MTALVCGFIFNTRFPPRYLARAGFSTEGPMLTPASAG
jgi:hypothetical protein